VVGRLMGRHIGQAGSQACRGIFREGSRCILGRDAYRGMEAEAGRQR
jgi:hypothetical protein